jgi:hypothetical protein
METVITFITEFLSQEYRTIINLRAESDTRLIETDLDTLNQFFQGLNSGLSLSSLQTLEDRGSVVRQLQPRVLFQIKQYDHFTLGTIYRVYLSSSFRGDRDYFTNFYLADTEKGLKIIARYNLCNDCNGIGTRAGVSCQECSGLGWKWRGGQQLDTLGASIAVRKFEPPIDIQHLQEYESA